MTKLKDDVAAGFLERLTQLLDKKNNGNQSVLARAIKVSPQAVNRWFSEGHIPREATLNKVAAYLGTTPAYLKYGDGPAAVPATYELMYVQIGPETSLLSHYREGTASGKEQLLTTAEHIEKLPADQLPANPQLASN
jgi:transcriptional regulator with XRE-family HTH domain